MTAITITDLENAALDVATIGGIANSASAAVTDRLGQSRPTMTGLAAEYPAASVNAASALVSKNAAGVSETNALASKVAAESARDAAIIGAGVYTTEALGRAAVADGVAFKVQGAGDVAAYEYRRTNSGASVLIATYPSSAALGFQSPTNFGVLQVADSDGNISVSLALGATLKMDTPLTVGSRGHIGTNGIAIEQTNLRPFAMADNDGNLVMAADSLGRLVANFGLVPVTSTKALGTYDYEVNHLFTYGQSLSVGQATPALSTNQNYDNLMFTRGMVPQYSYTGETAAQWYASLIPAVETASAALPTLAETPGMGAGDCIKERILLEDGLAFGSMKYQLLLSAPGYGATTIAQLSKSAGTGHYERMIAQAGYGLALANASGKTYAAQAVTWTQGESDYLSSTTQTAYVTALNLLVTNFNADFKAATGQTKSIPLISYQTASHKVAGRPVPNIALGQLEVEAVNELVYIATPMYHFDYQDSSNFHLTAPSSRWLGAYHGLAYKRIVIDGIDWKPCKPIASLKQGAIAVVKFNVPSGRLALDTTAVALNTNYGFELVDSAGAALTISSVSLMGPDTVKIIAAATIPAGARLRYAWSGSGNVGKTVGPRGNLRDSQGDTIIFDPQGIAKPMHNWCVIFELEL